MDTGSNRAWAWPLQYGFGFGAELLLLFCFFLRGGGERRVPNPKP